MPWGIPHVRNALTNAWINQEGGDFLRLLLRLLLRVKSAIYVSRPQRLEDLASPSRSISSLGPSKGGTKYERER